MRLHEVDGVRGWASLAVVNYHLFWTLLEHTVPGIRNPVLGFFFDGSLAVSIFFVLSGEALSFPYFAGGGDRTIRRMVIKRYFRLTLPILVTCALVYGLHFSGLIFTEQANPIVKMDDWMGTWFKFDFTAGHFAKYVLLDVYLGVKRYLAIDPFLWTMKIEMPGSILVFMALFALPRLRGGWIWLTAITLLFMTAFNVQVGCVLIGLYFSAARCAGVFDRVRAKKHAALLSWVAVALLGALDGWMQWRDMDTPGAKALIAIGLLAAVYCNGPLTAFFQNGVSRFLGKMSFPLYLMQIVVIISLTAGLVVHFGQGGRLDPMTGLLIAGVSLIACLAGAVAFYPVEILTRRVGDTIVRAVEGAISRKPRPQAL